MLDAEWTPYPQPPKDRPKYGLIIGINIVILLVLQTVATYGGQGDNFAAGKAILLCLQVAVNLFLGLVQLIDRNTRKTGVAFLLAAMLVALIGFGTCIGFHELAGRPPAPPGPPVGR